MAEKAAKSIADMQEGDEESDSESSAKEEEKAEEPEDSDDESHKLKKLALAKLEDASEESLLSQASFSCFLLRKLTLHVHAIIPYLLRTEACLQCIEKDIRFRPRLV